jgi:hypothetical protein
MPLARDRPTRSLEARDRLAIEGDARRFDELVELGEAGRTRDRPVTLGRAILKSSPSYP